MNSYYNTEYGALIICPYCRHKHNPSEYLTDGEEVIKCDKCKKPFTLSVSYEFQTQTIPGQMTKEEWEKML